MFRIKKLDIFITRQFLLLFVGTFFICLFVLMMQFLWMYVDDLIGKGLTLDVLGQFFWYMSLMMVPQALPLAILLSSLISFGNLGESSELTAIKSAGISLMQTFRSLIVITILIMGASFVFQNNIGPKANQKITQLLISMKQKSPELEIPEGIFYDGIPNCNLYVQKKDLKTGKLYGIMIYRMTQSYEDQAIILADSGMLQSTEEKKHLVLNLWSGEWFENMESSEFGNTAAIPYRRETFAKKRIILDFDGDFSLTDAADLSNNSKGKSLAELRRDVDSMSIRYDSIGKVFMADARMSYYRKDLISKKDSLKALTTEKAQTLNFDSLYNKLSDAQKLAAVNGALNKVQAEVTDLEFKKMVTSDGDWLIRRHRIEEYSKFTLALSCLIFFFIGAPLGAIIRKGGLGIPIIVSVLVFIFYFILDNTGYRMSREGIWAVWFGKGLSSAVLIPIAIFVTYKANNDSMVFNLDLWKDLFMRMLGLRIKRHVYGKEVVIQEPRYAEDAERLSVISKNVVNYSRVHNLKSAPNAIKLFFKYEPDHEIERISEELEAVIEDLSNTRDNRILTELNNYPILAVKAHTRPFERSWMNVVAGIFLPTGIFFYFRMWGFRLRLFKDLRVIRQTNANIISRTKALI
jgi:lipopolysaccharide export system permease protein